ncbi:MAG: DUF2207 domain-containing protein, partial [Clostridiales bacterium]|nr:DUF2207 domain-containing protein [Clostridiales bacterium]
MRKKTMRVLLGTLFLCVISLWSFTMPALADDSGYVIKDFHIDVRADEARAFHITETITVNFLEKRQGILRSIPWQGDGETYQIQNVSVEGAPFVLEEQEEDLVLRIGEKGVYQRGETTYIIKYTLAYYQDYYHDGDYIYLNLLGHNWDTQIYSFSGQVTYPSSAEFDRLVITSGSYGYSNTANRLQVQSTQNNNTLYFTKKGHISSYEGITVNIRLQEGAFPLAPEYVFPYTVRKQHQELRLTKAKELKVTSNVHVSVSQEQWSQYGETAFWADLGQQANWEKENLRMEDFSMEVHHNGEKTSQTDPAFLLKETGEYDFVINYTAVLPLKENLSLETIASIQSLDAPVEDFTIDFTSEVPILREKIATGRQGDKPAYHMEEKTNEDNSQSVLLGMEKTLYPGEIFDYKITVDNQAFYRPLSPLVYIPILVGILSAGIMYMVLNKKGRDQKIAPVVAVYPPQGLSGPEAGYVLNRKISSADMITILYNWANEGLILISEDDDEEDQKRAGKKKKEELKITKLSEIEPTKPIYEIALFNQMFALGENNVVTDIDLKNIFYKELENAKLGVVYRFTKGEKKLYNYNAGYVFLGFLLGALPLLLLGFLSTRLNFIDEDLKLIAMGSSLLAYGLFFAIWTYRQKPFYFVVAVITLLLYRYPMNIWQGAFSVIPLWVPLATIGLSTLTAFVTAFLPQRTKYGQQITQEVIGFKRFIEVAEKERLEALIEEDPAYFYHVLPYAQVFGLTKVWTDKFNNITLEPPTWYASTDPWNTAYTMMYISRMQRAMTRFEQTAISRPSSSGSSSGSFSGSSGGGFSGGGFSGGGGGGG